MAICTTQWMFYRPSFPSMQHRGGFKGGGATPLSKSGGCLPVIFDIFDSGFYITYTNYTS